MVPNRHQIARFQIVRASGQTVQILKFFQKKLKLREKIELKKVTLNFLKNVPK
jgi:hypothetical protein